MNKTIPFTKNNILLTFRAIEKKFELKGGLLKMMDNKNSNVDLDKLLDTKLMFAFAKVMNFDGKVLAM